jgi:hypothetical protein
VNKHIIVAVVVVTAAGAYKAFKNSQPLTPVIIGAYVFFFVLAIMDTYGGPLSALSGALAMLAMTVVLLTEIPWTDIIKLVQGKK